LGHFWIFFSVPESCVDGTSRTKVGKEVGWASTLLQSEILDGFGAASDRVSALKT
jgi:hypothetical protein